MSKILLRAALACLLCSSYMADDTTKPAPLSVPEDFKSDGCSVFPDGSYRECCVEHDKAYYAGGSWRERLAADNALFKCVSGKSGVKTKIAAPFMWFGVRIGGAGFLPTHVGWGFGRKKTKTPA